MLTPVQTTQAHTTADLREGLLRDLTALRGGDLRPSEARCRAYVAKQIIDTLKVEAIALTYRVERFEPVPLLEAA